MSAENQNAEPEKKTEPQAAEQPADGQADPAEPARKSRIIWDDSPGGYIMHGTPPKASSQDPEPESEGGAEQQTGIVDYYSLQGLSAEGILLNHPPAEVAHLRAKIRRRLRRRRGLE